MKRLTHIQTYIDIVSLLLAFLFVYAAVSKLLDIETFKVQIGQSPLLTHMSNFVAWFIPLFELSLALMLVIRRYQFYGMVGSFGLMVLFTGYIISILQFSEHIPCACGGVIAHLGWKGHLLFNISFVLLSGTGVVLISRSQLNQSSSNSL